MVMSTKSLLLSSHWAIVAAATALGMAPVCADELQEHIDALVRPAIEDELIVGCVVGVVKDGESRIFAYGQAAKGDPAPPTAETIFEIGSATKAFTGALLSILAEDGAVEVDDPVQKYLPEGVHMPVKDERPITLADLATHTSGLPRLPDNLSISDAANPYSDYGVDKMYAFVNAHQLGRAPGKYEYSNVGMGLLGHVLALHAGATYEELIERRIAGPLKMTDTCIQLTDEQRARMAPAYDASLNPVPAWDLPTIAGAGALRSTMHDMLAFVAANLDESDAPLPSSLRAAHEKRHDMDDGLAIGLGWHIARDGVTRWHNGLTGGHSSWMSVVQPMHVGVVVLSNTGTLKTTELGEQITRVAGGMKVEPAARRKEVAVDPAVLESYAGVYEVVPAFALTVTVDKGRLMVQATGQENFPVFATSPTEFFYKVVDAQLTFATDASGAVSELVLHQNGRHLKAKRKASAPEATQDAGDDPSAGDAE
jgi:CubicO group peptidase (beta-lactamase class C family)